MTAALLILLAIAARIALLYFSPFGPCPRCRGRRRIMRGRGRKARPVRCPRCAGAGRRQRPGSRTVHRLARRIRVYRVRQRREHATIPATPKE